MTTPIDSGVTNAPASERVLARAAKLAAGATLADLAAQGDKAAKLLLDYETGLPPSSTAVVAGSGQKRRRRPCGCETERGELTAENCWGHRENRVIEGETCGCACHAESAGNPATTSTAADTDSWAAPAPVEPTILAGPLSEPCTACGAAIGVWCSTDSPQPRAFALHRERMMAWTAAKP